MAGGKMPVRARIAAVVVAGMGALAAAAGAPGATDPLHDSLVYCNGSPGGGGATGVGTDAEHTIVVDDSPPPVGTHARWLTVDGVRTRVIEAGPPTAEDAAVFLHGNPGSSRDFDALVAATGRSGRRAIEFDMPGTGHASDRPGGPYTTDGAAHFIAGVLRALDVERAHMVLHDFAGPWGLQWAMHNPDWLASAVLIDTGVFIGYFGHPTALEYHTPLVGEVDMATTTRQSFKAFLQANNPKPLPERFLDRMYDDFDRATRCAALSYYRAIDNPDAMGKAQAAALRKRRRPALVIWGAKDPFVPVSLAKTQRQAFPDARIAILPNDGHWPFVDEPARVRDLAVPFLRKVVRSPRFGVYHGRLRAGRRRAWRADVRVLHASGASSVRLVLRRGGRMVGGAAHAVSVREGRRRVVAIRLRRALRAGHYVLRIDSRELARQRVVVRVRR